MPHDPSTKPTPSLHLPPVQLAGAEPVRPETSREDLLACVQSGLPSLAAILVGIRDGSMCVVLMQYGETGTRCLALCRNCCPEKHPPTPIAMLVDPTEALATMQLVRIAGTSTLVVGCVEEEDLLDIGKAIKPPMVH